MMKRFMSVLLVCVLLVAVALSGCGQKNTADNGGTGAADPAKKNSEGQDSNKKTEIRVSWWGAETRHTSTLEAIKLFEQENPNIKIIPEYQGWDGYQNKLKAQVMAANAPDVFSVIAEWFGELIAADGLADITGKVDVSGHNPKYVEACSIDGKMYGVNLSVNAKTLVQNKTLLAQYGIEPLKAPYTWEDMTEKFKEVYEKSGGKVYGVADYSVNSDGMGWPMFQDYGYTKLSLDGAFPFDNDKYTFTKDQVKDYFQYFADLRKVNAVAPADVSATNDLSANSLLIKKTAAFEINWAGTFNTYQDQMKDDLVMAPLAVGPNGETGDVARPGLAFSVFKKSKNIDQAAKFIDYFTNSPDAAKVLKNSRGILPTEAQRAALLEAGDVLSDSDKKIMAVVDEIMKRDFKVFYPGPAGNRELQNILPQIGQKVAFNKISVDEAVEEFMKEVEKLSR